VYFRSISLTQFRNYHTATLDLSPEGNIFFGTNGQGKTNLLEALHCLCVGRSPRGARDTEIIKQGCDFYRLSGVAFRKSGTRLDIELNFQKPNRKSLKINGQSQKAVSEFIGQLSVVSVSPEDIAITSGSPSYRRRYLDIALSQTHRSYLSALQEYQRILDQRNAILKEIQIKPEKRRTLRDQLLVWDQQFAQAGATVIEHRLNAVDFLSKKAHQMHQYVSADTENLQCRYIPAFSTDTTSLADAFYQTLRKQQEKDEVRGYTTLGPHRDDLRITLNGFDLRTYGSQGQLRTACISLRIAEAEWLAAKAQESPIMLLDEVFAELDLSRTHQLMELFQQYGQVFIATAREADFAKCPSSFQTFYIDQGHIKP